MKRRALSLAGIAASLPRWKRAGNGPIQCANIAGIMWTAAGNLSPPPCAIVAAKPIAIVKRRQYDTCYFSRG